MKVLIIKLDATGDVLRTTPLLRVLTGEIDWLTSDGNAMLLSSNAKVRRCIPWTDAPLLGGSRYDLVINLEDSAQTAALLTRIDYTDLFGAYLDRAGRLTYTESSREWFDLSLISRFGKARADELKYKNRKTYQEIIFTALGYHFKGQEYCLPQGAKTDLAGDIAIATKSGPVWPMKNWAYFLQLQQLLQKDGYAVNTLPMRKTLLEHIGDVQNHRYLISGDSLPMHIALGSSIKCLTIFQCTSPWEICGYGVQTKMVSPLLEKHFYKRDFAVEATTSIPLDTVYQTVIKTFGS